MGVMLVQRIERFTNPFFTVVKLADVMRPDQVAALPWASGYLPADLWTEIAGLINPVTPQGQPIVATVEDLQAETRLKVMRARQAVDLTTHLLAQDIVVSSNWMEIRKAQDAKRGFGAGPAAALAALRTALPLKPGTGPGAAGMVVYGLISKTSISALYPGGPVQPPAPPIPVAQAR